jgi:hypothetical protein
MGGKEFLCLSFIFQISRTFTELPELDLHPESELQGSLGSVLSLASLQQRQKDGVEGSSHRIHCGDYAKGLLCFDFDILTCIYIHDAF